LLALPLAFGTPAWTNGRRVWGDLAVKGGCTVTLIARNAVATNSHDGQAVESHDEEVVNDTMIR